MFNTIFNLANCYFIALFSFLVFLKKDFLMIEGNETLPVLSLTHCEEQMKNNSEDENFINDRI